MLGGEVGSGDCLVGWLVACGYCEVVRRACIVWCLGWRWGYGYLEGNLEGNSGVGGMVWDTRDFLHLYYIDGDRWLAWLG